MLEIFQNIFTRLNIDKTVFIQFGIVVGFYLILKGFFFDKLLFVISEREKKTVKMKDEAIRKISEAELLETQYNQKMSEIQIKNFSEFQKRKFEVIAQEKDALSKFEESIMEKSELIRKELIEKITSIKKSKR